MYETDVTNGAILLPLTQMGARSGLVLFSDSSIAMIGYYKRVKYFMLNFFCNSLPSKTPKYTVYYLREKTPNIFGLVSKMAVEDSVV